MAFTKPGTTWPGQPLNYEQLVLEQIQRIMQDESGPEAMFRTPKNVNSLETLTLVDTADDKEYNTTMITLERERRKRIERESKDSKTGRSIDGGEISVNHAIALEKWREIMKSLKRGGRFRKKKDQEFESDFMEGEPDAV